MGITHIGICMDDYDFVGCADCPAEEDCLELYEKENPIKIGRKTLKITTDELKAERKRSHRSLRECYDKLLKDKLLAKVAAFKVSKNPRDAFAEIMTDIIEELL